MLLSSAYFYLKDKAPEQLEVTGDKNYSLSAGAGSGSAGGNMMPYFIIIFAVAAILFLLAAIFLWKKKVGLLEPMINETKEEINDTE